MPLISAFHEHIDSRARGRLAMQPRAYLAENAPVTNRIRSYFARIKATRPYCRFPWLPGQRIRANRLRANAPEAHVRKRVSGGLGSSGGNRATGSAVRPAGRSGDVGT